MIAFLIDQNFSVSEVRGAGGSVIFNIFIQNHINVIRLGSCSIEMIHFD